MARMRAAAEAAEKELEEMGTEGVTSEEAQHQEEEEERGKEEERQHEEEEKKASESEDHPELDELKTQLAALEHRLATVQGILKKSETENKSLREKITELGTAPVKKPELPKVEDSDYFADLKEEFGEKTAKAMIAIVRAETSSLQKENEELRDILTKTGERTKAIETGFVKSAEDRYFESLEMKHPDWEKINGNEDRGFTQDIRFTKFLGEKVPGTGKTYDVLLQEAYSALDVSRTAEIFSIFKDRNKPADPVSKKGAEHYIDPTTTGKGAITPKDKPKEKIYTAKEHSDLMKQLQTGTFPGTAAERKAMHDELIDAELEGRVR